ncbi:MAG: tetratricopeptide repeat protein [Spirochaetaceae bacterium]|nr:MAG: tetratricopeptide repeat protein [Spirochaetaceae bacterium]
MKSLSPLILAMFLVFSPLPVARAQSGTEELTDPKILYQRGRVEQARSNLLAAVELYRAALIANPAYAEPLIGLAESFFALEEYEEALGYLKQAQTYDRGNLELIVLEGRIAIALNQPQRARVLFESVLDREPNNLEARFGLAELDIAQGRTRNASQRYIETLKIRPESQKALLSLVLLSDAQGDRAAAQVYLELALKYHNYDPRVHYAAGRFSIEEGRLDRAERYLLTAIALDDRYTEAKRLLAQVYLLAEQPQRAIEILRGILETDRDIPLVWYSLGLAYDRSGDPEQGIRSLAQALRLRPDDEISRIALENIALNKLPINDPIRERYADYHLERGSLFRERNLLAKALMEYRRALRLQPEAKEPRLLYADIHRLMGYPEKYLRELEVLRDLGYTDTVILDDIEIIGSTRFDSVSSKWGIDQYGLDRKRFSIALYHLRPATRELHPFAGETAAEYLFDLLQRYPTLDVKATNLQVESYESAFRGARSLKSDYFLLMHIEESERSFTSVVEQYLTSTGKLLRTYRVFRTGNDRVQDNFNILAGRVFEAMPVRGTLLARQFDRGVIDLGGEGELVQGQELAIVRKGKVRLQNNEIGVTAEQQDILGSFTVEILDELVSEGTVNKRSFFDLINAGDEIIPLLQEPPEEPIDQGEQGLLRRVLNYIGL